MANYVPKGSILKCETSGNTAKFNPTFIKGTKTGTNKQGVNIDSKPENVEGNFGHCPVIGSECTKEFEGNWKNVSTAGYSSNSKLRGEFYNFIKNYAKRYPNTRFNLGAYYSDRWNTITTTALDLASYTGGSDLVMPKSLNASHFVFKDIELDYVEILKKINKKYTIPLGYRVGADTELEALMDETDRLLAEFKLIEQSPTNTTIYPYVTTKSTLKCNHGVITVVNDGQVIEEPENDNSPLGDLRKRVKRLIREHYDVGEDTSLTEKLLDLGVTETKDDKGKVTSTAEENAENIIKSQNIELIKEQNKKLEKEKEQSKNEEYKKKLDFEIYTNKKKLEQFGDEKELTDIKNISKKLIDDLPDDISSSTKFKIEQLLFQKECAENAIKHFRIDEAENLECIAWLVLLNENERGTEEEQRSIPVLLYNEATGRKITSITDENGKVITNTNGIEAEKPEIRNVNYYNYEKALRYIYDCVDEENSKFENEFKKYGIDSSLKENFTKESFEPIIQIVKDKAGTLPPVLPLLRDVRHPSKYYILSGYKAEGYEKHQGVDIMTNHRQKMSTFATKSGYIQCVRWKEPESYGLCIYIKNFGETNDEYVYGHHKEIYNDKGVGNGFYILAGKPLGECGETGLGNGIHLHFEVWTKQMDVDLTDYTFGTKSLIDPVAMDDDDYVSYLPKITYKHVQKAKKVIMDKRRLEAK